MSDPLSFKLYANCETDKLSYYIFYIWAAKLVFFGAF